MAVNGTCTNIHLPLPSIPETANQSINYTNSAYEPDRNGLAQILSTLLSRSTLSTENVRAFFDKFVHKDINSWTVSEILRTNPVLSVVIYTSVALGLFLIFSIIFCIISCRNSYKTREKRRKSSKINQISVCFLIIVFLIGIADMFYVAYRINKSKVSIDDTIQQFNREIYPKEISEHIIYLNKQLNQLDQYCTQRDSILINASKSILIETFDEILTTNYFISEILQSVNQTEGYVRELNFTIAQHTEFPPEVMDTFKQLQEGFDWMMDNIENPTEELCRYANDSQTEIDEKLVEALNVVHSELQKLNETIHNEILKEISPWNEHMLMSIKLEEDIREYFNIAGIVCMVLVLVLGGLPVVILVCVLISRLCGCYSDVFNEYDVNLSLDEMTPMPSTSKQNQRGHGRKVAPVQRIRKSVKSTPSCMPVCLMRIAFFLMMIILFILTLVTGVYYALDLSIQGSCRTIHNDQPYLINLLGEIYNDSIVIFDNQTQLNTTILNLLNDCQNHTHFTEKILANYWSILERDMVEMMNTLNRQIFDKFISTIQDINIPEDMIILKNLTQQVNATDILKIVNNIEQEFSTVNEYFDKINASNASLPHDLVQTTINQFEGYLKQVLNSTIDACPLPISTISKTDTLFCHTLANSMNGLWLSLFIFMILTTLGLSICGMNVYKRMSPIIITNRF